jgi:hypothetical protein
MKSIYTFDIEAYLNDCFKGLKGKLFLSKWDKEFKLGIMLPHMVRVFAMRLDIEKYIAFYFKEYIAKNANIRKDLLSGIPEDMLDLLGIKPENMFDYSFDYMSQKIICRLKSQYIAMIIYTTTKLLNKKMFAYGRI